MFILFCFFFNEHKDIQKDYNTSNILLNAWCGFCIEIVFFSDHSNVNSKIPRMKSFLIKKKKRKKNYLEQLAVELSLHLGCELWCAETSTIKYQLWTRNDQLTPTMYINVECVCTLDFLFNDNKG